MPRLYARAPDHLGDGVMALPAMAALSRLGPLRIRGPGWARRLYRGLGEIVEDPGDAELAVLFKPAFRAAWEARRVRPLVPATRAACGHKTLCHA